MVYYQSGRLACLFTSDPLVIQILRNHATGYVSVYARI